MNRLVHTSIRIAVRAAAGALAVLAAAQACAGPAAEALSTCLADNTTGKDRRDLARWVFVAVAAHPQMQDISGVTPQIREASSLAVGRMVTRLLGETCVAQAKAAAQEGGGDSVQKAFGELGRLAMQELVANPAVTASFADIERYVDRKKLAAAYADR